MKCCYNHHEWAWPCGHTQLNFTYLFKLLFFMLIIVKTFKALTVSYNHKIFTVISLATGFVLRAISEI